MMKARWSGIALGTVLIGLGGLSWFIPAGEESNQRVVVTGLGDVKTLQAAYDRWKGALPEDTSRKFSLSLGYIEGLSDEVTKARGEAVLDLINGSLSVKVYGLPETASHDVWLVDNLPGLNRSIKPEAGDTMIHIGSLHSSDSLATLETSLDPDILSDFNLDLVVVSRTGETPGEGGLLFGAPGLFQRLYYNEQVGEGMTLANAEPSGSTGEATGSLWSAPFRALVPAPAYAKKPGGPPGLQSLVSLGEILFTKETFNGNGRTCATCHRPEDNFTISPAFIATLPEDDPLFVADPTKAAFQPALVDLEIPELMEQFGLILENVDGAPFTAAPMRGTPHTLALGVSLTPEAGGNIASDGRGQAIGWSGDGAPIFMIPGAGEGSDITLGGLNGTLLSFALGAINQHFPLTLNRVPGVDFTFPNDDGLMALEAFQLSLGRSDDINLGALQLTGTLATQGKMLFFGDGGCNACHANAGANGAFTGQNQNFDTGVERLPNPAYRAVAAAIGNIFDDNGFADDIPCDGGFGSDAIVVDITGPPFNDEDPECAEVATTIPAAFGDGTFNTPPVIEAADTAPFFHNHSINTIEGAVAFYNSDAFDNSPASTFDAVTNPFPSEIDLEPTEVDAIAALLRVLNALENIRNSLRIIEVGVLGSFDLVPKALPEDVDHLLKVAHAEVEDAIQVLEGAQLHSDAVVTLKEAKQLLADALNTPSYPTKADLLEQVMTLEVNARAMLCVPGSDPVLCEA